AASSTKRFCEPFAAGSLRTYAARFPSGLVSYSAIPGCGAAWPGFFGGFGSFAGADADSFPVLGSKKTVLSPSVVRTCTRSSDQLDGAGAPKVTRSPFPDRLSHGTLFFCPPPPHVTTPPPPPPPLH